MLIDVSKIKNTTGVAFPFMVEEQLPAMEYQGESLSFPDPVKVEGQLTDTGKELVVQGAIHAHLSRSCSRCLEPVEQTVDIPFEVECPRPTGNHLDLGPQVQESLILELPITMLCREDCLGLCNQCGKNLNLGECQCSRDDTDPRLQILGKLLKT